MNHHTRVTFTRIVLMTFTRSSHSVKRGGREAGEEFIMRCFITCTIHQILLGGSNQEGERGGLCNTHVTDEECIQCFGLKT
jgi:hypothetical protein